MNISIGVFCLKTIQASGCFEPS